MVIREDVAEVEEEVLRESLMVLKSYVPARSRASFELMVERINESIRRGERIDLIDVVARLYRMGVPEHAVTQFLRSLDLSEEVVVGTKTRAKQLLLSGAKTE